VLLPARRSTEQGLARLRPPPRGPRRRLDPRSALLGLGVTGTLPAAAATLPG